MSEEPIVWIGRKPKSMEPGNEPVEPAQLKALLEDAISTCAFTYKSHVVAHGDFGSWLVHLEKDGCGHRALWNGRDGVLMLEKASGPAGWEEVAAASPQDTEIGALVSELKNLLETIPS